MHSGRIDLNLLEYLDILLRERNVTRAASHLGLSQPAMSNGLGRLRVLFDDPLLVRTSDGMTPTERALELQPVIREVLARVDKAVQPQAAFDAATADPAVPGATGTSPLPIPVAIQSPRSASGNTARNCLE